MQQQLLSFTSYPKIGVRPARPLVKSMANKDSQTQDPAAHVTIAAAQSPAQYSTHATIAAAQSPTLEDRISFIKMKID